MGKTFLYCLALRILITALFLCCLVRPTLAQRFVGISSQVQKAGISNSSAREVAKAQQAEADAKQNPLFVGKSQAYQDSAAAADKYRPSGKVRWQAALLADGDFSKAISATEGEAPKTGSLGATFTRFKQWQRGANKTDTVNYPHLQGLFVVSLGSQGDTIMVQPNPAGSGRASNQNAFGQSLLIPGSNARSAKSFTGSLLWRPHLLSQSIWRQGIGYNAYLNVTQLRWGYQNRSEDIRLMALSLGVLYTVFDLPAKDEGSSMKLQLLLNYSLRHISGDVREERDILVAALGSRQYWYSGIEPGLVFTVNSLRLTASLPFYQGNIKGFSNGQFVASLGFSTALNLSR